MQMKKHQEPQFTDLKSVIPKSEHKSFEMDEIEDLPAVTVKESEMMYANNCEDSASARPLQAARNFGNIFDDNISRRTFNTPGKIGFLSMLDQSIQSDLSLDFLDDQLSYNHKSLLHGGVRGKRRTRRGM